MAVAKSSDDTKKSYVIPATVSHEEAEKALILGCPKEICETLVSLALNDADWKWVQQKCIDYSSHIDPEVRGVAVTCLGHVARIHHELDVKVVVPVIQGLMQDPEVAGRAEDAWDDLLMYLTKPPIS